MTAAATIRDWLRDQGDDIAERGPLPAGARQRYQDAHPTGPAGPDYPPGMTDADFADDITDPPPPPPPGDDDPGEAVKEARPRNVAVTKKPTAGGLFSWRKKPGAKGKAKPKHPRVPVDDLIAAGWRGLASFARPLPPTSRLLKIQAPVAGMILEDVVRDTVVDRFLQPVARAEKQGTAVFALLGPPLLVTALQLQPEAAPFIMPVLRESLLAWVKVAGPSMMEAIRKETEFEAEFGATVDELISFLFAPPPGHAEDPGEAMAAEEAAVRRAQEALSREPA